MSYLPLIDPLPLETGPNYFGWLPGVVCNRDISISGDLTYRSKCES